MIASDHGDGAILPTWTAVDTGNVRTMRELMENMRKDGWNVEVRLSRKKYNWLSVQLLFYSTTGALPIPFKSKESISNWSRNSIPISPDRPIEVRSIPSFSYVHASPLRPKDNYVDAYLRVIKRIDPLKTALVFNCGMGAVRTTFAMAAACIMRRKQLMDIGMADPYLSKAAGARSSSGISTVRSFYFLVATNHPLKFLLNEM